VIAWTTKKPRWYFRRDPDAGWTMAFLWLYTNTGFSAIDNWPPGVYDNRPLQAACDSHISEWLRLNSAGTR